MVVMRVLAGWMMVLLCWTGSSVAAETRLLQGRWIQAAWSTARDGAELDGSRPMPVFRREFRLRGTPVRAVLRIAGLGQYSAELNDAMVAPDGLHQAWTDYRKTVTFDTWDVKRMLRPGRNRLKVMLGNGMYNVQQTEGRYTKFAGSFGAPMMIAELQVWYADGASEVIASDGSWQAAHGRTVFSSAYGGEDFDARRMEDDWGEVRVVDGPRGELVSAIAPDVRAARMPGAPVVKAVGEGKVVYDFGQNVAGRPRIKVRGPAGAKLILRPGELLNPDGTVSQKSSGEPQWWSYTLRGGADEVWEPGFGYYGFRYVQAEWVGGEGKVLAMEAERVTSNSAVTGRFESSNALLNKIHRLIVEAMYNNEVSLFTDCPHREKLGWIEETHLIASGLMFNNDLRGLYAATVKNIADAQREDGMVPTIAPQYTQFGPKYPVYDDSPEWGSASILAAWRAYGFYGDKSLLERNYGVMQRYVRYLEGRAENGIVAYGLGDWYDVGDWEPGFSHLTTIGVTGTLMLYEDVVVMQKIAALLHRDDDAVRYKALAAKEQAAFNGRFWNAEKGCYDTGSQTASAMPLALGVVPADKRAAALEHVIADIRAHRDHVTTGEVGYPYLLRLLMQEGRDDLILAMMLRSDPPSYGSQLARGATALTEAWDANPKNSQDHFMLGGAEEWFYRGLGGIDFDMSREERIVIRPAMPVGVDWIRCGFRSRLGKIESDWRRAGGSVTMAVTVPAGALVYVPSVKDVEGLDAAGGRVRSLRVEGGSTVYRVRAGRYRFRFVGRAD